MYNFEDEFRKKRRIILQLLTIKERNTKRKSTESETNNEGNESFQRLLDYSLAVAADELPDIEDDKAVHRQHSGNK